MWWRRTDGGIVSSVSLIFCGFLVVLVNLSMEKSLVRCLLISWSFCLDNISLYLPSVRYLCC